MAKVTFKRISSSTDIGSIPFADGSIILTLDGKLYCDFGSRRITFGGSTDTSMSSSSRNAVENRVIKSYVDNNILNIKGVIAWTNGSPTSSFAAQTISLSHAFTEGYDSYEILYRQSTSNSRLLSTGIIPSTSGTILNYCTSTNNYRATGNTMYDQTITFEDGHPSNDQCIPMYVIMYKRNLFN